MKINALGGMNKVMKTFNYAVKYKITDQEKDYVRFKNVPVVI